MSFHGFMNNKDVAVRTAIKGFDKKFGPLPVGGFVVVSVPQPSRTSQGVAESQREIARTYVNKILVTALQDGFRVKYAHLGESSKSRRKELEATLEQFPSLLALGKPSQKNMATRIQMLTPLLAKLKVGKGTDLILVEGIEALSRQHLQNCRGWVEHCYMKVPALLKYIANICRCAVVVVQFETHSKKLKSDDAENLWIRNADFALSLRQREGLCPVEADGTVRRGIEARLVKSPQGEAEDERWMV